MREASGDADGARAALARAKDLAPNYARVRWAYGNVLLRRGEQEAAFAEMRGAAAADPAYAAPLVSAAFQFFGNDTERVVAAAGESSGVKAALSIAFADDKRFDESLRLWQTMEADQVQKNVDTGRTVLTKMLEAKHFRTAVALANLLAGSSKFSTGSVFDGGFENGITMQNPGPFDWRVADGPQPQVALTDGQRHGGAYSLLLIFRTAAGSDLRQIAQTIAVEPGAVYKFGSFYRSDLKSAAKVHWQIATPDGRAIASTTPFVPANEFTPLETELAVPADTDGVIVSLVRDTCTAPCSMAGNVWLDDISLRRVQ
jgi:tetratricopeptide (TPR) repeat protein